MVDVDYAVYDNVKYKLDHVDMDIGCCFLFNEDGSKFGVPIERVIIHFKKEVEFNKP